MPLQNTPIGSNKALKILMDSIFVDKSLTEEEFKDMVENIYLPYKGYGGICVAEKDKEKALRILREHAGLSFDEYYEEGFISTNDRVSTSFSYGKFMVDDIHLFLLDLYKNDVHVKDFGFFRHDYD